MSKSKDLSSLLQRLIFLYLNPTSLFQVLRDRLDRVNDLHKAELPDAQLDAGRDRVGESVFHQGRRLFTHIDDAFLKVRFSSV